MNGPILRQVSTERFARRRCAAVPAEALRTARTIVDAVAEGGEAALRAYATRFDGLSPKAPLVIERSALDRALAQLGRDERACLERVAGRIRAFAEAQRASLKDLDVPIPGGRAGHTVAPVARAGCYAPGGRYPLPSSVLMTAIPARVAAVKEIWVASPRPAPITLAAAAAAGADGVLAAGGAHAIAALAYGAGSVPACDVVVGPGNRYVTAAKQLVTGVVGIDALAGPSELVIVADASADPSLIAADLLAQAEHDPDALIVLIALDTSLPRAVEAELRGQLSDLPTAAVARAALANGGWMAVRDLDEAVRVADTIAPEHLQLMTEDAAAVADRFTDYGALCVGAWAGVVLGDYGAGPNHVLPTGGSARWAGGLSVLTFLRARTWMRVDDPAGAGELVRGAAWLGRAEGLEGHARAAESRMMLKH